MMVSFPLLWFFADRLRRPTSDQVHRHAGTAADFANVPGSLRLTTVITAIAFTQ
jgi:hypothetical protein